jgi:DNA-binding transcriptional LysR family regulator
MVQAGLGLAVLPSTVVAGRATHRVTPIASPGLFRTIGLAHRSGAQPPRAAREFRQALMEYLAEAATDGRLPLGTELITPAAWRNSTWHDELE